MTHLIRCTSLLILGSMALSGAQAQGWSFLKIDPKATYLRDSQFAPSATMLALGIVDRTKFELEIRTTGWYNRALDNPLARNVDNQAVAVFSNGPSLDPDWSRRHRVHGAIQYGSPFYTLPTWVGNKPTDIEEDFGIGAQGLRIRAPQFATTLLFTPFDNGFWNNGDDFSMPGADPRGFGVEWRWVQTVPEPGTVAALSLGAVLLRRRKRAS
jgi:hypothetical protein